MTETKSTQEISDSLRPLRAFENRLIEADLVTAFGTFGSVTRIYTNDCEGDEAEVVAWTILENVTVDRKTLPVCGDEEDGTEEEGSKAFRREIVLAILEAYVSGQESMGRAA